MHFQYLQFLFGDEASRLKIRDELLKHQLNCQVKYIQLLNSPELNEPTIRTQNDKSKFKKHLTGGVPNTNPAMDGI